MSLTDQPAVQEALRKAKLEWDAQVEDQIADMRGDAFDSIVRAAFFAGFVFFILGMFVGGAYF